MNDEPKFTGRWRAAIVISLLVSFAAGSQASKLYEARSQRDEKRLAEMEAAIKKIEDFLYYKVAGSKEKSLENEQRIVQIESALKKLERPPPQ